MTAASSPIPGHAAEGAPLPHPVLYKAFVILVLSVAVPATLYVAWGIMGILGFPIIR